MLKHRSHQSEKMDNLNLGGTELNQTLDGLSIINKYLGNTNATLKAVKAEILQSNRPLHIIDLGCGGGDNLRAIAKWASQHGHTIQLTGIDGNPNILAYAQAKNTPNTPIQYLQADILHPDFELPECDILLSSHFMYHFSDAALIAFLQKAKPRIHQKIIFSELERSAIAYGLFSLFAPLLPFPRMVKQDGLTAIKRSFKKHELVAILEGAGFVNYEITWKGMFRWLVMVNFKK